MFAEAVIQNPILLLKYSALHFFSATKCKKLYLAHHCRTLAQTTNLSLFKYTNWLSAVITLAPWTISETLRSANDHQRPLF